MKINLPPSEEELEALFGKIELRPSRAFEQRMQLAPWEQATQPKGLQRIFDSLRPNQILSLRSAGLALLIILLLSAFSPPLQAMARRVADFFVRNDQDLIVLSEPRATATPLPGSPSEIAAIVSFDMLIPTWLPEGYTFENASYQDKFETVTLHYNNPLPGTFLRISQSGQINSENLSTIGPTAPIETIAWTNLAGEQISGEYVAGAWKLLSENEGPYPIATWDPNAKIHMLRWESAGILYEVIHGDPNAGNLTLELLLQIAKGLE